MSARGDVRPPDLAADEKTTLLAFLDYLRDSVAAKLDGLDDAEAREPRVPSGTSLLGLITHLVRVELGWFVRSYAGEDVDRSGEATTVAEALADYRSAIARANKVAAAADLDTPGVRTMREADPPTMRWILVHMIEETARHAGHADILREQLDGMVGR